MKIPWPVTKVILRRRTYGTIRLSRCAAGKKSGLRWAVEEFQWTILVLTKPWKKIMLHERPWKTGPKKWFSTCVRGILFEVTWAFWKMWFCSSMVSGKLTFWSRNFWQQNWLVRLWKVQRVCVALSSKNSMWWKTPQKQTLIYFYSRHSTIDLKHVVF